jgi:hypothetical protein
MEFSASSPPCGMEKGLWLKSICFVSSFSSYIGKSTIQQKRNSSLAMRPSSSPSRVRTLPLNFGASSFLPAAKNTASPGFNPQAARMASTRSASRFLAIGPFGPSAANWM